MSEGGDEANRNESLDGENLHFQKQLSPSTDFASVGKVVKRLLQNLFFSICLSFC